MKNKITKSWCKQIETIRPLKKSVYCNSLDQWVSTSYCLRVCGKRVTMIYGQNDSIDSFRVLRSCSECGYIRPLHYWRSLCRDCFSKQKPGRGRPVNKRGWWKTTMKCPDCRTRLVGIPPLSREEWMCINDACPSNKYTSCHAEFYGTTQKEINTQKRGWGKTWC